ncbi:hypothetical protein Y10_06150 [Neptunitalea sp. Y10]|uniref:Uncharacterized protein n=2 Tax=Neptunitalea lumnitzerae TaxID=2965509 RepID=A0ABQ5MFW1_9FLAO|nr:hypothetical protein Y10_06150 [Neptunitalea sp. Y10]
MDDQVKIPKEFNFFRDWYVASNSKVFYKDLQYNIDARNSAMFFSMALIPKTNYDFEFLNTDIVLSFNKNLEDRSNPIRVISTSEWPGYAYGLSYTIDEIYPNNYLRMFSIIKVVQSMSEAQVLASCINHYDFEDDAAVVEQAIALLNKKNGIALSFENLNDVKLNEMCKQIAELTGKRTSLDGIYKAFIEGSTAEETHKNLSEFLATLTVGSLEEYINRFLLPKWQVEFADNALSIALPESYFEQLENKKEPVSFNIRKIEYAPVFDYEKGMYLDVKIYPEYMKNMSFEFKAEKSKVIQSKGKYRTAKVAENSLDYIEFYIYEDDINVNISIKQTRNEYSGIYQLYKNIKFKKK